MSRLILAAGVLGLPLLVAAQPPTPSATTSRVSLASAESSPPRCFLSSCGIITVLDWKNAPGS